ncbi:MAG: GYD domain-containing protein [Candidatus Methylomirabilia bacterium]
MREGERPKDERPSDTYFVMWNLTEEGARNPEAVRDALKRASAMLGSVGGTCRLYVTLGGRYDFVGLVEGIDDTQATKLLHAVNALGAFRTTTFLKARDYYLVEYDVFANDVTRFLTVKP